MLLLFRDVTDQKELEETRQNLTSMIVHELRSPLQAVMGSMKLIEQVTPEGDPIVEQATDVSKRAVKKLLNLVNNLLDLSRMEVGEFVLDPSLEEVRPIITDSVEEVMPLAKEMGSVIKVEIADDLPYARIDRDMVERVVLNLLDNALKYTEPGSLLTAGARLPDKTEGGDLKIEMFVSDQGPGVPDDYKEAIFERFSQVPGRKGRRRSAGLGLAFSKLAIESHGGRIWVEDNPKGGSIFKFVLPGAQPPPAAPDEPDEKPDETPKAAPAEKTEAEPTPPLQIEEGKPTGENGKKPEETPAKPSNGTESSAASKEKPSGDEAPKTESE
jgi:signal transduction histidine kinase